MRFLSMFCLSMIVFFALPRGMASEPEQPNNSQVAQKDGRHICPDNKIAVGDRVPGLTVERFLNVPPGTSTKLNDLKGKLVIIEFWATWCGPCLGAIPHWNELADQFRDDPVQFISITGEPESVIVPFLKKRPIKGWVGLDPDYSMDRTLGLKGIVPQVVIIDKNGDVAAITDPKTVTRQLVGDLLSGKKVQISTENKPAVSEVNEVQESRPLFELVLSEMQGPGQGRSMSEYYYCAYGIDAQVLLKEVFGLQSSVRIEGKNNLPGSKYKINARVPQDNAELLYPLIHQVIEVGFKVELRLFEEERTVYVLTVPQAIGPGLRESPYNKCASYTNQTGTELLGVNSNVSLLLGAVEEKLGIPVVNETGLSGQYDWNLVYKEGDRESVLSAIRDQFGLEIALSKRKIKVLAVKKMGLGT